MIGKTAVAIAFACFAPGFASSYTASVRMFGVDTFGQPLAGCSVREFTSLDDDSRPDFGRRFHGLIAGDIPLGRYVAGLKCANDTGSSSIVQVDRPKQFLVICSHRHTADYAPGKAPLFEVKLVDRPRGTEVWAKLAGVYLNSVDIEPIGETSGVASFVNPDPGQYTLLILAPKQVLCRIPLVVNSEDGMVVVRNAAGCPILEARDAERAK